MRTVQRLTLSILINAIFFAVVGFLLNLLPFLQTRVVNSWADVGAILISNGGTGVLFGIVWYFLAPLVVDKMRRSVKS